MRYYDGVDRVDYDLLKTVMELVRGYEVDDIPLWAVGSRDSERLPCIQGASDTQGR